ncbi:MULTISPECIES: LysE family translocator [unclassified Corynebacterium]
MSLVSLLTLMGVWLVAMASPGPDVIQIIRLGSRSTRAGLWAALGSSTGLLLWVVASLAGLSALIDSHPGILITLQLLGGTYLLWMAYSAIKSGLAQRRVPARVVQTETFQEDNPDSAPRVWITAGKAYRIGFICDLSNPKVVIFFGAVFSNFLEPGMSLGWSVLLVVLLVGESLALFGAVALTVRAFSRWMSRHSSWVDLFSGVVFLLLAAFILYEGVRGAIGVA